MGQHSIDAVPTPRTSGWACPPAVLRVCGKCVVWCAASHRHQRCGANTNGAIGFQCLPGINHVVFYTYQDSTGQTPTIGVHGVPSEETWTDAQGKSQRRVWAGISSGPLTCDNGVARGNRGARDRWVGHRIDVLSAKTARRGLCPCVFV